MLYIIWSYFCNLLSRWTFKFASRGAPALLGYAPEELVSATAFRQMIPKEDQEENRCVLSQISKENPHYELVYRIRTASGKIKWVKEEGTGVHSAVGELVSLDGFLVDITDQKTAKLELREENLRLKSSYFLKKFSDLGVNPKLPENASSTMINYSWPGNVRELQNVISRFLTINKIELASKVVSQNKNKKNFQFGLTGDIEKMEKEAILDALKRNNGHIGKSANELGFSIKTCQSRSHAEGHQEKAPPYSRGKGSIDDRIFPQNRRCSGGSQVGPGVGTCAEKH